MGQKENHKGNPKIFWTEQKLKYTYQNLWNAVNQCLEEDLSH